MRRADSLRARLPQNPVQLERDAVMVVLCELVDEQNALLDRQNTLLAEQNALLADIRVGRRTSPPAGPAPNGEPEGKGGASVQLREPDLPPAGPDGDTDSGDDTSGDRAVAEPATGPAPAGKSTARKAPAKATAETTKATPAGRRRSNGGT